MWMLERAMQCPNCGTRPDEWEDDLNAYYPKTVPCVGCEKLYYQSVADRENERVGVRQVLVRPDSDS